MSRLYEYQLSIAEKMLNRKLTRRENYHLLTAIDKVEKAGGQLVSRQVIASILQTISIIEDSFNWDREETRRVQLVCHKEVEANLDRQIEERRKRESLKEDNPSPYCNEEDVGKKNKKTTEEEES